MYSQCAQMMKNEPQTAMDYNTMSEKEDPIASIEME